MTIAISRDTMMDISAAFYAKKQDLFEHLVKEAPENVRFQIYYQMWKVMGMPSVGANFGEQAFWNSETSMLDRIKAVEKVILEDINFPVTLSPIRPENFVAVTRQEFYDTGFDPRFTVDGNFMEVPQRSLGQIASAIVRFVAYYIFVAKSYLSFSEERQLRKTILKAAFFEQMLSSYCIRAFREDLNDPWVKWLPEWIPLAEHDFLETAGNLYKKVLEIKDESRPFPREVISPIHCINKPQNSRWASDEIKPGMENGDLARAGVSFARLNREHFTLSDALEYDYVPHYLFIHATHESAEKLKLAFRELRQQIAETTTDLKCAFSFAACKAKLTPALSDFNNAWNEYFNSHELLQEAQVVWSQKDHRQREYDALRQEVKMPSGKIDDYRADQANRRSKQEHEACDRDLFDIYRRDYPASKTGRLMQAIHERV
jgi:hypothetical protein